MIFIVSATPGKDDLNYHLMIRQETKKQGIKREDVDAVVSAMTSRETKQTLSMFLKEIQTELCRTRRK